MKTRLILAALVSLALAVPAFAQDPAASAAGDAAPAASASADAAKPAKKHHARKHRVRAADEPTRINHKDDHLIVDPPVSKFTVPGGQ